MNNLTKLIKLKEDWDIVIRNKPNKWLIDYNIKGFYMGDRELIEIYSRNIEDNDDYNITLIHEIYHVIYPNLSEENVEFSARQMYKINPNFAKQIKQIFNLPINIK